jgi:hypothetical protein
VPTRSRSRNWQSICRVVLQCVPVAAVIPPAPLPKKIMLSSSAVVALDGYRHMLQLVDQLFTKRVI